MEIEFSDPRSPHSVPMMFNPPNNKRSKIELIAKLVLGLVITALLAAIFIVVIVRFPTNNSAAASQGQETIIKLLIKSNEHIAELQREHEIQLERTREIHMNEYHQQDYLRHLSEQKLLQNLTYEFLQRTEESNRKSQEENRQHQWFLEQQRASMIDKNRREDQERQNENDLDEFFSKTNLIDTPQSILEQKVLSLIRRFQPLHKSLLIKTLYKENLLNKNCKNNNISCYLRLGGADLTGLQLGKKDEDSCPYGLYNYLYLSGTNLRNASFDCLSLSNADLLNTNLTNASFSRSRLSNTSLALSDLTKCNFQDAQMDGITLFYSSIVNASFQRASLIEAKFQLIKGNGSDFSQANLAKSSFTSVSLVGAKFDNANISEIELNGADLENVSFAQAYGDKSDFWDTHLTNTNFREAILPQSQFLISKGNGTDFSNANLHGSNFRYVDFTEASFYNATMDNVSLSSAKIIDSNFRYASLIEVDFVRANLTGSDFSEANLNQSKELTEDQLETLFSISNAILPNGTIGKNKNLIEDSHPICNQSMNNSQWIIISSQTSVIITNHLNTNSCVFQSTVSNITSMAQLVDVSRYVQRMINAGSTNILIEVDVISGKINADLRLFNSMYRRIDQKIGIINDTMNQHVFVKHPIIDSRIAYAELEIHFLQMNTAIDDIHLSIEV